MDPSPTNLLDGNTKERAQLLWPVKKYEIEGQFQHDVLKGFGARSDIWIWRQNVGLFYGYNAVASAKKVLEKGNVEVALSILRRLQPVRCGNKGQADVGGMIVATGRAIGWELKDDGKLLDPDQIIWRDEFVKSGGLYGGPLYQCWEIQMLLWEAGLP